jgi:hypothetical protein
MRFCDLTPAAGLIGGGGGGMVIHRRGGMVACFPSSRGRLCFLVFVLR